MMTDLRCRHESTVRYVQFDDEHDKRCDPLVQIMLKPGRRHEVIVHCIQFDAEHDERSEPLV